MVDSKGPCTSAITAGDAWADAGARLAGSAQSDASVCAPMIGFYESAS